MITTFNGGNGTVGAERPLVFGFGTAGAIVLPTVEDGHINYSQIRAASRSGPGDQFQMLAGSGTVAGHVPMWDSQGDLIDSGTVPGGGGGVTQIVAGTNISISPVGGTGVVTVTASGGSGSVTSVALTMPTEFVVAGSPITSAGTLAVTKANETANQIYAGPYSGSAAAPTFRGLLLNDYPFHSESLTDGNSNFIFAVGDIVTVVGVPN